MSAEFRGCSVNEKIATAQTHAVTLQGLLDTGATVKTHLDREGRFVDGRTMANFRKLTHQAVPIDSPGLTPVRILTLASGERLPIRPQVAFFNSVQPTDPEGTPLAYKDLLFCGQPISVPFAAVASVATPHRAQDVIFSGSPIPDSFWSQQKGEIRRVRLSPDFRYGRKTRPDGKPSSKPGVSLLAIPNGGFFRRDFDLPAGDLSVEISVVWPRKGSGAVDLLFEKESGFRLSLVQDRIRVSRLGLIRAAIASPLIAIEDSRRPMALRLTMNRGVTLSLGGRVLAHGSQSPDRFRAIVVRGEARLASRPTTNPLPMPHEAGGPVPLACLVQRKNSKVAPRGIVRSPARVAVERHDGDIVYGDSLTFGPVKLVLNTRFGITTFGATEVARIRFPRSRISTRPVSGDICQVQLAPDSSTTFFGSQPVCELTGAVRFQAGIIEIDHPLLRSDSVRATDSPSDRRIAVPWANVRKIEPLFHGEYRLLDPGPRHLGNRVRRSFSQPQPDGTQHSLQFELSEVPSGQAFLSLDVTELEPGSPETLQATPKLAELRRGFLTTNVLLNEVDAGTLNQYCEFLSPVGTPKRLRIPLPGKALKRGLNVLSLRQNPGRDNPEEFDDCELRRIAIELEG